ncbi:MAG: nucleotidyltransferase domain-containing protein [Candidatus Paceibacterota bacterium]|jgi:predicted nucleotidyltransferase
MNLNFTKNQKLILEIFFNDQEKEYYLSELAKKLNKKPGVFQRDINDLTKDNFLTSSYGGNRRFFKLNKKYPLYKEIQSIFFKTTGIEGSLKRAVEKIEGVKRAFIYGSYALGKERPASDVDLFVIGTINENTLIDAISKLEEKISREINYTIMTEKEFNEKKKNNSFVKNVLNNKIIELA